MCWPSSIITSAHKNGDGNDDDDDDDEGHSGRFVRATPGGPGASVRGAKASPMPPQPRRGGLYKKQEEGRMSRAAARLQMNVFLFVSMMIS